MKYNGLNFPLVFLLFPVLRKTPDIEFLFFWAMLSFSRLYIYFENLLKILSIVGIRIIESRQCTLYALN